MDFVTKSFRKDETLTSWTLLQHICPHFWAWLLNTIAITPKSEDKYVVKVFNPSEFRFSEVTFFQNWYFKKQNSKVLIKIQLKKIQSKKYKRIAFVWLENDLAPSIGVHNNVDLSFWNLKSVSNCKSLYQQGQG